MEEEDSKLGLAQRTFQFALAMRFCMSGHEWPLTQWRDVDQILRSSGSVAAHFVEAGNAASKPDFFYRVRLAKKECAETRLRLRLLGTSSKGEIKEVLRALNRESEKLIHIFAVILRKDS